MRSFLLTVFLSLTVPGFAQVTLENPTPGQTLTGLGLLSGWACEAQTLAVQFNDQGAHVPILYGSPRADTEGVCGHEHTGFALLVNWNELGAGEHTLKLLIDGQEALTRSFAVLTYGEAFLRGQEQTWWVADWPEPGTDTRFGWRESKQNIEIIDIRFQELQTPTDGFDVRSLLGEWEIDCPEYGYRMRLYLEAIDRDGDVRGHTGGSSTDAPHGYRVYADKNTYRWFREPLRQFQVTWIDSATCHFFAFDLITPNRAEGYYWYGYGVEWDECQRDAFGTFPAAVNKRR